jgi:hypothetical protein
MGIAGAQVTQLPGFDKVEHVFYNRRQHQEERNPWRHAIGTTGVVNNRAMPITRRSAPSAVGLNLAQQRWEVQPTGEYPALNPRKKSIGMGI